MNFVINYAKKKFSLSKLVRRSYKVKRLKSRSYFLHQPNKSRKDKGAFLVYTSKCAIQTRSNSAGGHCWIPFLFAQRDTSDLCRMTWGISTQVLLLKWRWLWQNWFRSRGRPEMSEFRTILNDRFQNRLDFIKSGQWSRFIGTLNKLLYMYEHMIVHLCTYTYLHVCTHVYFTLKSCKHFSIVKTSASLSRFIRIYFRFQIKIIIMTFMSLQLRLSLSPIGPDTGDDHHPVQGYRWEYDVFTVQILN